jgi:hypothetical protein
MGQHAERREKSRREKLDAVQAAIESGSLRVRQASEAERAGWSTAATDPPARSNLGGVGLSDARARLSQPAADPNLKDGTRGA